MLTLTRIVLNKYCNLWGFALSLGFLGACSSVQGPVALPPVSPPQVQPPVVAPAMRAPRLGLALGGGAARGFAHVGVIQVLEQAGIRPDLVAGTSAGSLVAAFYASGMTGARLEQVALGMERCQGLPVELRLQDYRAVQGQFDAVLSIGIGFESNAHLAAS